MDYHYLCTALLTAGHHMTLRKFIIFLWVLMAGPLAAIAQINTEQMLRVGQNALYFDDYMVAIQYFNRVIEAKPYLAQPYFFRAVAKFNLEDYDGAVADATLAIERNPFITDAYEVRGVALSNLGKYADAIADYDSALEQLPDNRPILYNKAMAQMQLEQPDSAKVTLGQLLRAHPRNADGYIARARLEMEQHDSVAAMADVNHALELNKKSVNGHIMRADLNMRRDSLDLAIADIDEALRLEPRMAGLYVNRSIMRYKTDDYFGAMADLDYALELEPANTTALYNRALLRAEVHDNNRALEDLNRVISLKGKDYRAIYNRAILYKETGDFKRALADADEVIARFPDFAAAYFLRFDIEREKGDLKAAERDYKKSVALAKATTNVMPERGFGPDDAEEATQEDAARRFTSLLAVDTDDSAQPEQYNSTAIRGRVQDTRVSAEMEPMMALSYYTSSTELKPSADFLREADEINRLRLLNHLLLVTNHVPPLDDEAIIKEHFESIRAYDNYLTSHQPRAIDYFGRAMDRMTLRDYDAAIADLDLAVAEVPDFTLAYLVRSYAQAMTARSRDKEAGSQMHALADLDRVIELSPGMAVAYYNKGCIYLGMNDFTSALAAFNKAIELKPDFGEAYYNRGFTYMKLGDTRAGVADLSAAGQLGIAPSYPLLKRINLR